MADKKISALTAASTPLAGTEVLPIVQSGATVKVAVSDLTAGRAISATQLTLTTGNVIVASGQGIDFSATPGTGTSELLADYEEGTWTPVPTPVSGSITSYTSTGQYIKVGNQVTVALRLDITNAGTATAMLNVAGLPFTSLSAASVPAGAFKEVGVTGDDWTLYVTPSTTVLAGRAYNNSNLITSGYIFYGSCTYFTA